jgi:hypothetical protein
MDKEQKLEKEMKRLFKEMKRDYKNSHVMKFDWREDKDTINLSKQPKRKK